MVQSCAAAQGLTAAEAQYLASQKGPRRRRKSDTCSIFLNFRKFWFRVQGLAVAGTLSQHAGRFRFIKKANFEKTIEYTDTKNGVKTVI